MKNNYNSVKALLLSLVLVFIMSSALSVNVLADSVGDTVTEESAVEDTTENEITESGESSAENVALDSTAALPSAVTNLKAAPYDNHSVKLTWEHTSDVSGYMIYKKIGLGGSYTYYKETTETSYIDTDCSNGEYNFYRVYPYLNSDGGKIIGEQNKYVYAKGITPLSPVTGISVKGYDNKSVKVKWDSHSGADGYMIYKKIGLGGSYSYYAETTEIEYTDIDCSNSEYNFYRIYPYVNVDDHKVMGEQGEYAYAKGITPLSPVSGLSAIGYDNKSVKVKWNSHSGADGYIIYKKIGLGGSYSYYTETTSTTYIDTACSNSEYNFYCVYPYATVNGHKVMGEKKEYVYAKGITPPAPVTNLSAAGYDTKSVKVTWSSSSGANGYMIYKKTGLGGSYSYYKETTSTTYIDTSASSSEYNFYKIYPYKTVNGKKIKGTSTVYVYAKAKKEASVNTNIYVTTTDVNLRSGAGTNYSIVTLVDSGTKVTVTDKSNSQWYKVKLSDGKTGYIFTQYLKLAESDVTPPADKQSYYKVTASSGLNLRTSPVNGSVLKVLNEGEVLIKLAEPSNGWVKVKTLTDTTGYVSTEYITPYTPTAGGNITVSTENATVNKYKTYYVESSISGSSHLVWSTSNSNVATVNGGFIYGVSQGTANITVRDALGTSSKTIKVTVTAPEAVRFAYSDPNTPSAGVSFNLAAVTDKEKTKVKFVVDGVGTYETTSYEAETASRSGQADNTVRIFKKSIKLNAGTYNVRAYATSTGSYSDEYQDFVVRVISTTNVSSTSNEQRRASDEIIKIIANFEGFTPVVTPDALAYGVPTVGYGKVVYANNSFYNNLTDTEGYAQLRDTVNSGPFTYELNSFISNNQLYMNQAQFDALVSFSYNVGTGWIGDSTVSSLLLNTVSYKSLGISSSSPKSASIYLSTAVYANHGSSSVVANLSYGKSVKVTDYYVDGNKKLWYKITFDSKTAWVRGGNIKFASGNKRDLNYIDAQIFAYKLLEWHVAGGNCIEGLLYRRNAEAKVFLYANYAEAYHSNSNYYNNTYNFSYPSCMKKYE